MASDRIEIPLNKLPYVLRLECCDCGLIHTTVISIEKKVGLKLVFYRDDVETAIARSRRRKKCQKR